MWADWRINSALIGLAYLSMFLPTAAMLIVSSVRGEASRVHWHCFPLKYLPVALFLTSLVLHAAMLPLTGAFGSGLQLQSWLTPQADGLYHTPASRGWGAVTISGLATHIVPIAVVGLLTVSFFAFLEEIGWRAWLLPRLAHRLGGGNAVVVPSIVWALWHVPFQLSGIRHISGVSPTKLASRMPFGIMAAGFMPGWLWIRTESIWLVAVAHGASNNWGQYTFKFMKDSATPAKDITVLGVSSLVLPASGAFLLWSDVESRPEAPASNATTQRPQQSRSLLLQRDDDIQLSRHTANACHKCEVTRAEACRKGEIHLVQSRAG